MQVELSLGKPELTPNAQRAEDRAEEVQKLEEYGDTPEEEIAKKEAEKKEIEDAKREQENPPAPENLGKFRPDSSESFGDQITAIDKSTKICK